MATYPLVDATSQTTVHPAIHNVTRVLNAYAPANDGVTDDTTCLTTAINELPVGGSELLIGPGSYAMSALPITKANVKLRAVGPAGATSIVFTGSATHLTVSAANVTIEGIGLVFTSSTAPVAMSVTGTDFVLKDCAVTATAPDDNTDRGRLNVLAAASRARIVGNTWDGHATAMRLLQTGGEVSRNIFTNCRGPAVYLSATDVNVEQNQFLSIAGSGVVAGHDAILAESANNCIIARNSIAASREHGIYLGGTATPSSHITIANNEISGHPSSGIKVLGTSVALAITDILVEGNQVHDGSGSTSIGVQVGYASRVQVKNNSARLLNVGVKVDGGVTTADVVGNTCTANTGAGIYVIDTRESLNGVTIEGNTCHNNSTAGAGNWPGIQVTLNAGFASSAIYVTNNHCSDFQTVHTQVLAYSLGQPSGGSTITSAYAFGNWGVGNTAGVSSHGANWVAVAGAFDSLGSLTLQNTIAGFYSGSGTPESAVTASPGSYYADYTNGEGYIKKTGTGNTGWKLVTHA